MDGSLQALLNASDAVYLALNGLSGRSWLFDALVALAVDNDLVKAGPVAAAFFFAWQAGGAEARLRARRRLLVTLVAVLAVLAVTKSIADNLFLPRPFVQSQQAYHLDGERLVETARLPYRAPLEGFSGGRFDRLREGEIDENDLRSFPSDHAAFFFALALGILFAHRGAGLFAAAWAVVAICGSRIVTGAHSPLDIVAGLAIGGALLILFQLAAGKWLHRPFDAAAAWTVRRPALAASGLFLILFEVANTLENVREVLRTGRRIAERVLGL